MANNDWGLSVGQSVEWETTGHGSIRRKGKVIALVPAGVSVSEVEGLDVDRVGRGIKPSAQVDRYAVMVPKLDSQGNPNRNGKTEIKLPVRWQLEKVVGQDNK